MHKQQKEKSCLGITLRCNLDWGKVKISIVHKTVLIMDRICNLHILILTVAQVRYPETWCTDMEALAVVGGSLVVQQWYFLAYIDLKTGS